MKNATDIQDVLQSAANQIFAVVAPTTSRLVRIVVLLDERAPTACTDGRVVIKVPHDFCGVDVRQEAPLAVGLLTHEVGHFLQPLEAILRVEQATHAPHWLANVLLDIHDEMLMATLFPGMAGPLETTRTVVSRAHLAGYTRDLLAAQSFAEAAGRASLIGRFGMPDEPFGIAWLSLGSGVIGSQEAAELQRRSWWRTVEQFLYALWPARDAEARDLPELLRQIMLRFPDLKQAPAPTSPFPDPQLPAQGELAAHGLGGLRAEAGKVLQGCAPTGPVTLDERRFDIAPPEKEAVRLARTLRPHFDTRRGAIEVVAPGRVERREVARAEGVPFRMGLPGREVPAPRVVIVVDVSDSMWDDQKIDAARIAAQAMALAVQSVQGEVVGILFSTQTAVAPAEDLSPLFAPLNQWFAGGTTFTFLPDVWRRFPDHRIILVTDGDGAIPFATPADKARTAAILIPPGTNPDLMQQIADRVVTLHNIKQLPWILAMLVPRRSVG